MNYKRNKAELALPGMDKPFYLSYSLGRFRQFEVVGGVGSDHEFTGIAVERDRLVSVVVG